jgi:putative peptidoglycan lipid II flippase
VLGLARDIVLGVVFGPSAASDAFFVAFKVPNFLRRLFAEGAFQQAFVPVLAQARETGGDAAVRSLYARVR